MIEVRIELDEEHRVARIGVSGHAGQAAVGQDVVCSAASILAYTAAQRFKDIEREGGFVLPPVIEMDDGYALIACEAKDDEAFEEVLHAVLVVRTGYSLLVHNYPQYVGLKVVDMPRG